jgi:hypothetical protein
LKRTDKVRDILGELAARVPDNLTLRLRLAQLHGKTGGQPEKAEQWALEALHIDVASEEARNLLLAALRAQKKDREAERVEARYR